MTQHIEEARELEPEWRYEIQYGPEGEANYAWLYRGNEMVATMKTRHAVSVCAALAAAEERGRIEERERFREAIIPAYMGLLVLKTMCRKEKLMGGVEATKSALSSLVSVMPELPAISALRTPAITKEPTP